MTITLTREEAQQALDAMTRIRWAAGERDKKNRVRDFDDAMDVSLASIETLRARLSAPEPEPVACPKEPANIEELYTAPPQRKEWQGLTDEEIRNEANHHVFDESFFNGAVWARGKIKEKNNG